MIAARSIAAEFLALPPTAEAREVVHAHVDRTEYVDVDDAGIFTDVDDPAGVSALERTRCMKRVMCVLWAMTALVVLAVVVPYLPADIFARASSAPLKRGLGREVDVGGVELTLFPGPLPRPGFTLERGHDPRRSARWHRAAGICRIAWARACAC